MITRKNIPNILMIHNILYLKGQIPIKVKKVLSILKEIDRTSSLNKRFLPKTCIRHSPEARCFWRRD